jgi:FAD:protein FMN transferase
MKQTRVLMDMPITVEVVDPTATEKIFSIVFSYFEYIDQKFSTFKPNSEITRFNKRTIEQSDFSDDMKTIFALSEQTKRETNGYFDIFHDGKCDPSGLVKGWAIYNATDLIGKMGFKNYYVDAGGDVQTKGVNGEGKPWRIGIKNPFNQKEIIKIVTVTTEGVATSGTYIRGQHIYNPKHPGAQIDDIVSLSVIGPNIYEADRFATAAFAMGKYGIQFIEERPETEGYMIDKNGIATMTRGFNKYVIPS